MEIIILKIKILIAFLSSIKLSVSKYIDTNEKKFIEYLEQNFSVIVSKKLNKRHVEKIAFKDFKIKDPNDVKELTELFMVNRFRKIIQDSGEKFNYLTFSKIVENYKNQVNLSQRTSTSVMLQQYSTPGPIAYLCGIFCKNNGFTFEPSAGNGMMTIALDPKKVVVNEISAKRNQLLKTQEFMAVTAMDASKPFPMYEKTFDAVITNPPFGSTEKTIIDGFQFKTLEHLMSIYALQTINDYGKAAIIVGGHINYDDLGRIDSQKNRMFLGYLWKHYNVIDYINIDGKLYSRMGTSFPITMILINGRKKNPNSEDYPPLFNGVLSKKERYNPAIIETYDELYSRFNPSIEKKKIPSTKEVDPVEKNVMSDSWRKEFERAKAENDLSAMQKLYDKVRVVLNGIAQMGGEKVVKEFENLKREIEDYAEAKGQPINFSIMEGEDYWFHGTTTGKMNFDQETKGNQLPYGVHFTQDINIAKDFASGATKCRPTGNDGKVIMVKINAPKLFDISKHGVYFEGSKEYKILNEIGKKSKLKNYIHPSNEIGTFFLEKQRKPEHKNAIDPSHVLDNASGKAVKEVLQKNGYDAAIKYKMRGSRDPLGTSVVYTDAIAILDKSLISQIATFPVTTHKASESIKVK